MVLSAASRSTASSGTDRQRLRDDGDRHGLGRVLEPVDRLIDDAERDQDPVHDPEVGVEDELEEDTRDHGRDRPGHQDGQEEQALAAERCG